MKLDVFMKKQGISNSQLARKMEVTASAVNGWRTNRFKPSTANLIKLAEVLRVEVKELV